MNKLPVHMPLVTSWKSQSAMHSVLGSVQLLHFYPYSNASLRLHARLEQNTAATQQ